MKIQSGRPGCGNVRDHGAGCFRGCVRGVGFLCNDFADVITHDVIFPDVGKPAGLVVRHWGGIRTRRLEEPGMLQCLRWFESLSVGLNR